MSIDNTITYLTEFEDVLQERLNRPQTWKEMCKVIVTNTRVLSTSYMGTEPSVTTVTRGTGIVAGTFSETAETMTISTGREILLEVDFADLAQSPWTKPVELFDRIGSLLNEFIETNVLAQHASWTDFDNASIGGGAGNITVSPSNIDDIIRGVKREIREANGQSMWNQNGLGFVWRAADFELLEAFAQANGFMSADAALKNGTNAGMRYMDADHWFSNSHAAGHVFAGVKKIQRLGILKGTYGKARQFDFPAADTNTVMSGTGFHSRVDIGHLTPTAHAGLVFDVLVA